MSFGFGQRKAAKRVLKVFISQPMSGRTEEEILEERARIITHAKTYGVQSNQEVEILDTFIQGAENVNALFCLGHSIMMLSKANIAFFGDGWWESRGCQIEHECCDKYNIETHYV